MSTSDHTTIPDGYKRCNQGENCKHPDGPILPQCEFAPRKDTRKPSLRGECRICVSFRLHLNREAHLEERKTKDRAYHHANLERRHAQNREWRSEHREEYKAQQAVYREQKREELRLYARDYAAKNPEKLAAYRRTHRDVLRVHCQRRQARKLDLPDTFTVEDLGIALGYFHGVCAYCGHPAGLFDYHQVLHADHYVPLNDPACPGTVPGNMVPACQSCNESKGHKNPRDWLVWKFGKREGGKIEQRILAFFDWRSRLDE